MFLAKIQSEEEDIQVCFSGSHKPSRDNDYRHGHTHTNTDMLTHTHTQIQTCSRTHNTEGLGL